MSLPSDKYAKQLLQVKKQLLQEIASRLDHGRFDMNKTVIINMKILFGECFRAQVDIVKGDEKLIKLYRKDMEFAPQISFNDYDDSVVEDEIAPLMTLLDYIDMDSRKH